MKTLKSMRLQIGVFGRTNAGKSSLLNKITNQEISIVSDIAGTTTDVVEKSMELLPVGPVTFLDTAGLDDNTELGEKRVEKNQNCLQQQLPSNVIHCFSPLSFEKTIKGTARLPCGRQTMPCSIQFGPGARRRRQRRP